MNLSYFIAKRISHEQREGFSSTLHTIATVSIAVGLLFLIVAFLILKGFQETVENKIYGFSGHLIMKKLTSDDPVEEPPFAYNTDFYKHYQKYPNVSHVQEYAYKVGLIKTEDEAFGVVMKGVGKSFDTREFQEDLVEGSFIHLPDSGYSREILLSRTIANKLDKKVGDELILHFFQNPPRSRKLTVSGIYETNLSEYFDSKVIIGDIRLIQRLNGWADSIAGGLEIFVKDVDRIDDTGYAISEDLDYDMDLRPVTEKYIQLFEWLHLLGRQVNILLVIIITVIGINMISIVLILVVERTQMIGMLKALGARNKIIRWIFMHTGISLIVRGLFWGNVLGLGICFLQDYFQIIKLNAKDYYMSVVPISWHWEIVLFLNILIFIVITVVLLLPTLIVARISPIRSIRFD